MKEIALTQGQAALVDDDMFEELNQHKWFALKHGGTFYARRNTKISDKETATVITMHHAIIGKPPKGKVSDHCNGCGIDNQRHNLRFVTYRQNQQNRRDRNVVRSSQYPGVHWCNRDRRWVARLMVDGKTKCIGYFTSEFQASQAYRVAVQSFGEAVIDTDDSKIFDHEQEDVETIPINVQINGKEKILGFFTSEVCKIIDIPQQEAP